MVLLESSPALLNDIDDPSAGVRMVRLGLLLCLVRVAEIALDISAVPKGNIFLLRSVGSSDRLRRSIALGNPGMSRDSAGAHLRITGEGSGLQGYALGRRIDRQRLILLRLLVPGIIPDPHTGLLGRIPGRIRRLMRIARLAFLSGLTRS